MLCLVTQSCPTLCDPMDCSLPGFSVNGILRTRILPLTSVHFVRQLILLSLLDDFIISGFKANSSAGHMLLLCEAGHLLPGLVTYGLHLCGVVPFVGAFVLSGHTRNSCGFASTDCPQVSPV